MFPHVGILPASFGCTIRHARERTIAHHSKMIMKPHKKPFYTPTLEKYGAVEEVTRANGNGGVTDRDFPAGTERGEMTFS